jgi:hypothetical protein
MTKEIIKILINTNYGKTGKINTRKIQKLLVSTNYGRR